MIKTVSFAPPRAVRTAASSNKNSGKGANTRAASSVALAKSSPAKVQSPTQVAPSKTKNPESVTATLDFDATPEAAPAPKKPRVSKIAANVESKSVKRDAAKVADELAATAPQPPASQPVAAPKAKRSRVPKDLAAQYGGASQTEEAPRRAIETVAPRKRLTRAKKEARSQLLRADDEVLQRLQQANAIEAKKPERRGRGWEFECGCCGRVTRFQTPGAICECGAIAVRE